MLAGILGATAALAVAGCGDSSPIVPVQGASGASGLNGPTALTRSEFIREGDAICGEANAALDALASSGTSDASIQASQELQITRSELESLQSLTPPPQGR
ncbi:MAG: hypothetical protein M3O77_01230, partial [Chloroflexota bacterium]|nr:hypothetical protein [Chloroflexota bacterium]